jgi:hypothetical protein
MGLMNKTGSLNWAALNLLTSHNRLKDLKESVFATPYLDPPNSGLSRSKGRAPNKKREPPHSCGEDSTPFTFLARHNSKRGLLRISDTVAP